MNLSPFIRMQMAKDIALGLNWLHDGSPVIIHGGLNPQNCLVSEAFRLKVSDFGLSAIKQSLGYNDKENVKKLRWYASELSNSKTPGWQ